MVVVVVSFGSKEAGRRWMSEVNCDAFPLFVDPERRLYRACGLHRSLSKETI